MRKKIARKLATFLAFVVLFTTFGSDYNSIGVRATTDVDAVEQVDLNQNNETTEDDSFWEPQGSEQDEGAAEEAANEPAEEEQPAASEEEAPPVEEPQVEEPQVEEPQETPAEEAAPAEENAEDAQAADDQAAAPVETPTDETQNDETDKMWLEEIRTHIETNGDQNVVKIREFPIL